MLTAAGPYGSRPWTYDKFGNRLTEAKTVSGTAAVAGQIAGALYGARGIPPNG